ncbi:MAG: hypothetical protein H7252_09070, partial [Cytophaga sp.]|nr:hypothetical protein [Undibacterium sp.]
MLPCQPPVIPMCHKPTFAAHIRARNSASGATASSPQANPRAVSSRHPEQGLFYHTIAEHFETWLALASSGQFDGQGDLHTPLPYVEGAF